MFIKTLLTSFTLAISCAVALTPLPALSHHGVTGQFDLDQVKTVTGVVTRVRFVNPHSYVYFDVTDDAGEVAQWRCELRSGSLLRRKGWTTDMFEAGTEITIEGSPDRRDPTTCYAEKITFMKDGTTITRYDSIDDEGNIVAPERETSREDGAPNFDGNWSEPIADGPPVPYAGPAPAYVLTQAAIDAADDYVEEDNPRFKCQPTNIILDYRFDQMVNKIEQSESEINVTYGFMDMKRTIHIGEEMPDNIEPSRTGYSVGEWDGDTLVVTTSGFNEGFLQAIGGRSTSSVPHSDQMEITERFSLQEDGTELRREYTIVDPVYLAEPHSHLDISKLTTDPFTPYECDDLTERKD